MGGREEEELLFSGYRVSAWENKKVLEIDGGDILNVNILNATELYS